MRVTWQQQQLQQQWSVLSVGGGGGTDALQQQSLLCMDRMGTRTPPPIALMVGLGESLLLLHLTQVEPGKIRTKD